MRDIFFLLSLSVLLWSHLGEVPAQGPLRPLMPRQEPKWCWEWESHVDSESGQTLPEKKKMLNKIYTFKHYRCTKDCANLGNVLHEVSRLSYTWSRKKYIYCHVQQKAVHLQYIYAKSSAEVHHRLEGSSHHSPSPLYFLFFYGKHAYYAMLTSTSWSLANFSQGMTNASIKPRSQSYFSKISLISMAHILSSTWGIFNITHWKKHKTGDCMHREHIDDTPQSLACQLWTLIYSLVWATVFNITFLVLCAIFDVP